MLSMMNGSKQVAIVSSIILIALLMGACGILPSEGINDATVTSVPTLTPVPPTVTPTTTPEFVPVTDIPTPLPTSQPPPILTPDAMQAERWKEYQTQLAKVLFTFDPNRDEEYDPERYKDALCEWDILGRSAQEVYVWAACNSSTGLSLRRNPALIYLKQDGAIREVNMIKDETDPHTQLAVYDLHLLPKDVQEKLCLYYFDWVPQCSSIVSDYVPALRLQPRVHVLLSHLEYRLTDPEEPPLVVLSVISATTPTP